MRPYQIAWIVQGLILLLLPVGAAYLYFRRHEDRSERAWFVRRTGMALMAGFALLFGSFIVGETLADPGGRQGVVLVSTWLVPLAALGSIAWFKPAWGVPVLGALTAGVVILSGWAALDPDIRALEDRIGPFTMIALFAVAVAVGALGHARIRAAGIMLLVLGTAPGLLSALASPAIGPRLAMLVVGAPLILTGTLYLAADRMDTPAPRGTEEPSSAAPDGLHEARSRAG